MFHQLAEGDRAGQCPYPLKGQITTLFSGINPAAAAQMGSDMNEDNSMGIVIEESSDALDGSKTSAAPDLGDDQAFPFIPGFGKNSGKD